MIRRLSLFCMLSLVTAAMFAGPAAHAFTMEDGKGNTVPKFDLDEQVRQFKTPQLDLSTPEKKGLETPFGTLQFGVNKGPAFGAPFGSNFGSNSGNADRRHYERMFTPEYLQGGGRGPN